MTRLLTSAYAILLIGVVTMSCAQTGRPTNLATNGGFEQGLDGWQPGAGHKLLEDPQLAHSGNNCLFGEVTEPSQAQILKREFDIDRNNLYVLNLWAKATNRTKLVVWCNAGEQRWMVRAWQRLPNEWRKYSTVVTMNVDAPTTFEIVAPSSYGAPTGKMWIDDITLQEYSIPPASDISGGDGFNDFPRMACTSDGTPWFAWISFRDGADTLRVARGKVVDDQVRVAQAWQVEGGPGTHVLYPALVSNGDAVWLAYASERDGNWDIYVVPLLDEGPGERIRVTTDPAVDVKPSLALTEGGVAVAWESNRGGDGRQIYLTAVADGMPLAPIRLSTTACDNYRPTIIAPSPDRVVVVWHSFRNDNFDLYWYDTAASAEGERRLTTAPIIDRDARLIAGPGGIWLIWEQANPTDYNVNSAQLKHVRIAKLGPDGNMQAPVGLPGTILHGRCEQPDLAFDRHGRMWVTVRIPRGQHAGWDLRALCYSGGKWSDPLYVSGNKGMCRQCSLAPREDNVIVCYQADAIPNRWDNVEQSKQANSVVYAGLLSPSAVPAPAPLSTQPYTEPNTEFQAAELRVLRGEDRARQRRPTITYNGENLNLYFGNLHVHSDLSVCNRTGDQTQDQSYQAMRDISAYDFGALTDHGYNFNDYLWNYTSKCVRANNDPGRFITFLAHEWTSTFEEYTDQHPYGYYGHRNLFYEDPYCPLWFNAWDGKTPPEVWQVLRDRGISFIHIPHQLADTGNVPMDWSFVDRQAQPVAEIFQARGSYEYKGCPREAGRTTPEGWFLQDAWARGIVIGVVAAPDHPGGRADACVWAADLTREAIFDAVRKRHTYGTTTAKIFLDFRVNGHLMGEQIADNEGRPVRITIRADCPQAIDRVGLCRNNEYIKTWQPDGKRFSVEWTDNDPPEGPLYYYARVIQEDDEIAWSSPVWVGEAGPLE